MKLLVLVLFAASALAAPNYPKLDFSQVLPVQDRPGFWDGRDFPEEFKKVSTKERRIIGGNEAARHSIPWQVALYIYNYDDTGMCGGTVLGTNAVLTAAHCLVASIRSVVFAGMHMYQEDDLNLQDHRISNHDYRLHENYNPQNLNNDIAIMLLVTPWQHNAYVQPTRLPTAFANELFVGETATVSGWGYTTNSGPTSRPLRVATVPVITNPQCAAAFGSSIVIASTLCVSTTHGQGHCHGDSGGPLTVPRAGDSRPVQIGIASFVGSTCVGTFPAGYARVTSFLDWIERFLR